MKFRITVNKHLAYSLHYQNFDGGWEYLGSYESELDAKLFAERFKREYTDKETVFEL